MKILTALVIILSLYGASAAAGDEGTARFNAGVLGKTLVSIYGGAGISFPWGALNFTGTPRTDLSLSWNAGVRIARPVLWWGGPIAGMEYASRPISASRRTSVGGAAAAQRTAYVQALAGWRQYTGPCFYGTGLVAGYMTAPWRKRILLPGGTFYTGPWGSKMSAAGRIAVGLYTEVGFMVPLHRAVTLDITAQLQGFVVPARSGPGIFIKGTCLPMSCLLIAGVTARAGE